MTKVELSFSESANARLKALQKECNATKAEVIRNALQLYEYMIQEKKKGTEFFVKNGKVIESIQFIGE
ncbi:hypothetical protein H6775_03825 [Candidatus Nomurabacteria bacterium]|nr:hypothetical protein [Candidatus Nomurabacteria bacterium]